MNLKKSSFAILFLVIFIDMIGVGIVVPVLAPLMLDTSSNIVPSLWDHNLRNIMLGFLIGSYPLMQFFGAPILGTLSDRYGRKPILGISLFGTLVGYLIFAYGLLTGQLWMLFASRALDGFTGGNIAVAMSSIADMSKQEDKAKNFGLVGAAFGIGFVLGPFLGGVLSDSSLVSWFSPSIPFLFASALTAANLILLLLFYKETILQKVVRKISLFMGFINIHSAFKIKSLAKLFIVIGFFNFGFSFFTQFFPAFLVSHHGFDEKAIGMLFGVIGIFLALNQGLLTRFVSKVAKPQQVLQFSLLLLSLTLVFAVIPDQKTWLYITQVLITFPAALSFPNATALASQLCPKDKQGEILGINQSVQSLGHALPPILSGFLVSFGDSTPTLVASFFVFISWALFMVFRREFR